MKIKGKYNEDLSELPLLSDLNTTDPAKLLKRCDVCKAPTEKVVGSEYKRYRALAKKATDSEEDTWTAEHAWDYSAAKIVPAPDDHHICDRVRNLETANVITTDHLVSLGRELEEKRSRPLLRRIRYRVGCYLHRLGELVQR